MARVICLVGAGGKSTIMYELAEKYAKEGRKVVVTTSTHIWEPEDNYVCNLREARALWQAGLFAVVGRREYGTGKLIGLTAEELAAYENEADVVLVEADGAKGKPCKVPGANEPVILPECDTVVAVVGLDTLGQPVENACFRIKEVCALLKVNQGHILNEKDLVKILLSEHGTKKAVGSRKYYIALNKCDNREVASKAAKLKNLLLAQGRKDNIVLVRGKDGLRGEVL